MEEKELILGIDDAGRE